MEFKDLVHARRMELGLTLEEVGERVGVSKATVLRWESGEIENVRRDKIALLSTALHVTPAYLMGWEEAPTTPKDDVQGAKRAEFAALFDQLTQAQKELVIAAMRGMLPRE